MLGMVFSISKFYSSSPSWFGSSKFNLCLPIPLGLLLSGCTWCPLIRTWKMPHGNSGDVCGIPITYFFLSWGISTSACLGCSPVPSHGCFIFFIHLFQLLSVRLALQGILLWLELDGAGILLLFKINFLFLFFCNLFLKFNALCSLMIKSPPLCLMGASSGQFL